MKNFKLFISALILPLCLNILYSNDFEANKILVKFNKNSKFYETWLKNNKTYALDNLKYLLGENKITSYLPDNLLTAPRKKVKSDLLSINNKKMESLSRIAIIEFNSKLDPIYIAKKLSNSDDFEYAEPISKKYFYYTPNDQYYSLQYYINQVNADKAWDLIDTSDKVVVGIVDTGVDYLHNDLNENIYINSGEIGLDKYGHDKRTNGKDDDGNGFVDDWHGWDLAGADGYSQDNDPHPGNIHGTHVAGTIGAKINNQIGVAGTANNVKLLPIKIANDDPNNKSVINGFQGILYASIMGADIINCSWGGSSYSKAEQEIIDSVTSWGSLVIGACGNDNLLTSQYPASYIGVISVAAIDSNKLISSFSNISPSVDVSAPGVGILATIPNNYYMKMDGTSMAAPIVSGVAAMVKGFYKNFSSEQIKEQIKYSSLNIDSINPSLIGYMGVGEVDAFKAINGGIGKSLILKSYTIVDSGGDGGISKLEPFTINLSLKNVLKGFDNCKIKLTESNSDGFYIIDTTVYIGKFETGTTMDISDKFRLRPKNYLGNNLKYDIFFNVYENDQYISRFGINVTIAPTFITMDANNLSITFNSIGNIAFNDYPNNLQGKGYKYKQKGDMLFEGSLIVFADNEKMSDVARNYNTNLQDASFFFENQIENEKFRVPSGMLNLAQTRYRDSCRQFQAGVDISQSIYQYKTSDDSLNLNDYIISVYNVKNISGMDYDSLFLGLFLDWDVGSSGANNFTAFNNKNGYAYCKNMMETSLPIAGVELLTNQKINFYAIDNNGSKGDFGIYSSFGYSKKYMGMTSGLARKTSSVTDVSNLIGGGPVKIKNGDSTIFAFAFLAGDNQNELDKIAYNARLKAIELGLADTIYIPLPFSDTLKSVYPNPISSGDLNIDFEIYSTESVCLQVVNSIGQIVSEIIPTQTYEPERYSKIINVDNLSQGYYLVRLITAYGIFTEPFVVIR